MRLNSAFGLRKMIYDCSMSILTVAIAGEFIMSDDVSTEKYAKLART